MPLPSLCLTRDVVERFFSNMPPIPKLARDYNPEPQDSDVGTDVEQDYSDVIERSVAHLLHSVIEMDPESPETGFWGDEDVIDYVRKLPDNLIRWVEQDMGKNLADKLNRKLGSFTYTLSRRDDGKPVARFEAPKMNPEDVYNRFATLLSEESEQKIPPKQVREDYRYDVRVRPFYDETDFRTDATVKRQSAVAMMVDMLTHYMTDPRRFSRLLAQQRVGGTPATTWLRPPKGKTQSGTEEKSEKDRREMDPAVASLMFDAKENNRPVEWLFSGVRTEGGREGEPFNMLDLTFPDIGKQIYSVAIPADVGGAIRDARPGEKFYLDVLDYDPGQGFKVRFPDQAEKIFKSSEKSVQKSGVTSQQLANAVRSMVRSYVKNEIRPSASDDVSEVVEKHLGKVLVDGKNIGSSEELGDLMALHESRMKVKDPRGRTPGEGKEEIDRDVLKTYLEQKRLLKEREEESKRTLGPAVSKLVGEADPVSRVSKKISEVLSRRFPVRAPFTDDSRTWTMLTALKSRDAVRWLIELALDEALPVTMSGSIPWTSLVEKLFESDLLADAATSGEIFDERRLEPMFQAMKVATVGANKDIPEEQKRKALADYRAGTLRVTPDERRQIVKELSARSSEALRKLTEGLKEEIMKVFMQLHYEGDPDVERIVEVSKSKAPESMTREERAEWGVEPKAKGQPPTPSFKKRVEDVRTEEQALRAKGEQAALGLERMLLNRDFMNAQKTLESAGVSKETMDAFNTLKGMPAAEPGTSKHNTMLGIIETISDGLEEAVARPSGERMLERYRAIGRSEEKVEKPEVLKRKRGRPRKEPAQQVVQPIHEVAQPVQEVVAPKQASLYRLAVRLAMVRADV